MKRARSVCAAIAATAFALTVVVAVPSPAVAETSSELQAQLDKAKATRDDYYAQAEAVSDQLNATREQLSETESQIADTQKNIDKVQEDIKVKETELARRQALLAENVSENYKSGGVSLLSLVLEANSFDDFVTRVYYADKISETQASNIEETNRLRTELAVKKGELDNEKATLEDQKSQQEQLVSQQEAQQADLKSKVDEADSYVNSLDSQVKEALAQEAEAARQAAEREAAAAAAAAAANSGSYYSGGGTSGGDTSGGGASGGSVSSGGSTSGSVGGLTSAQRNTILSAAYSLVGKVNYVWGGENPSTGLDCSGFTRWCYAQAGISLPHSSASQRAMVSAASGLKSPSNAIPGDIVCWEGHVGIYAGGSTVIDCNWPPDGVRVATIWNTAGSRLYGAGSPI